MEYQSYKNLQNSELEWIKCYPAHWTSKRFKFLLKDGYKGLKIGPFGSQIKSDDLTNEGYKIYGQENVINRDFTLGYRYLDEEKFQELTVYEIFSGDLLITMMGTSGKCEIAPGNLKKGIMDSHLIRLRTNEELFVEFAQYLIDQSDYVEYQIQQLGKGSIMHGLNSTVIKNLNFLLPPIEEQYAIVKYLDYKTQQIDQQIEKKKALIEKLNEQRIAVITQAVTKGIDKNAKMKPSGVDWLGDVPEHWEARRLKFAVNLLNRKIEAKETLLPYMGMENIESFTANKIYDEENPPQSDGVGSYFKSGDVLFGKLRPYLAKAYLCETEGFCSSELLVLEGETTLPEYLVNLVLSDWFIELVNSSTYGSKMPRASWDYIGNMICPIPEKEEQEEIVSFISTKIKKIEQMKEANKSIIERLKEYRTSLITSAVTGKIDIRNIELPNKDAK